MLSPFRRRLSQRIGLGCSLTRSGQYMTLSEPSCLYSREQLECRPVCSADKPPFWLDVRQSLECRRRMRTAYTHSGDELLQLVSMQPGKATNETNKDALAFKCEELLQHAVRRSYLATFHLWTTNRLPSRTATQNRSSLTPPPYLEACMAGKSSLDGFSTKTRMKV